MVSPGMLLSNLITSILSETGTSFCESAEDAGEVVVIAMALGTRLHSLGEEDRVSFQLTSSGKFRLECFSFFSSVRLCWFFSNFLKSHPFFENLVLLYIILGKCSTLITN